MRVQPQGHFNIFPESFRDELLCYIHNIKVEDRDGVMISKGIHMSADSILGRYDK